VSPAAGHGQRLVAGPQAPDLQAVQLGPGARALFTTRAGGVSTGPFAELNLGGSVGDDPAAVRENRACLRATIGVEGIQLAWMRQVHGAQVARVTQTDDSPEADAIFTDVPGIALGVLVADCAPVLVADPGAGLIGAAHAGRPGLAAGVLPALVKAMVGAGAAPTRMHALIGPVVCGGCYEVPAKMRDEVDAAAPGSACRTRKGTPGIDIRAGLHKQLADAGLSLVSDDRRCPAESADLYSYRRDGSTGRFAGVVWLVRR
jgi:polyphenol oxidase